jgi:ATP-dependent Clp protease ATP-binding subunit ClpA
MIARELEITLHKAFVGARKERYEYITVEYLLLALLSNASAGEVLRGCNASIGELRDRLTKHVDQHTPTVAIDREVDTQPTLGFQRVLQRAILHVQSSGKKEVSGADVLAAMYEEKDSHAVYFLKQQGIERRDLLRYISHGVTESPPPLEDSIDVEGTRQIVFFRDAAVPAEFAARVLEDFLMMDQEEIAEVLKELDGGGKAVCGLYPRETAEFVVDQIRAYARKHGQSLRCETAIQK